MKSTDQSDLAFPLTHAVEQSDDLALMPGEFAGMYQSGFEAGYKRGHETGYDKGFAAGMAAVRQTTGQPWLLRANQPLRPGRGACSLACHARNAECILMSDETQCPSCKQMRNA